MENKICFDLLKGGLEKIQEEIENNNYDEVRFYRNYYSGLNDGFFLSGAISLDDHSYFFRKINLSD